MRTQSGIKPMNRRNFLSVLSGAAAAVAGGLSALTKPSVSADGGKLLGFHVVKIAPGQAAELEMDWFSCYQPGDMEPSSGSVAQAKLLQDLVSRQLGMPEQMILESIDVGSSWSGNLDILRGLNV